jgi:hypothetical protein
MPMSADEDVPNIKVYNKYINENLGFACADVCWRRCV